VTGVLVDSLRTVSLAEVLETAALQHRIDRKYLVDDATALALTRALDEDHRVLAFGTDRTQAYSTVYFDSPDLACHRAHLQGRRRRWKARTRRYPDGSLVRLELKTRDRRGRTVKDALDVEAAAHGRVDDAALDFLDERLRAAYGHGLSHPLVPTLELRYCRTTLVADAGGERLTLDTDLEVRTADGSLVGRMLPDAVLVESKAGLRPGRADRALRVLGAREASCSKYCVGIALAVPTLPAAPWRPLLRRWFVTAAAEGQVAAA
jgi:hypothetical protein